ncbi:hypothetical protein L226DRAFT_574134 [Lentinus tigrinus ALCF2SS1-7]|uniref:F-box domain-containing protein n=1 Tax=Lentinus tigrinus ALCF2SS1-6 TaxID=1328759 RepID=A0A5C2S1Y4_9APHY|nr:hypothetical protein L227DRAFT_614156 [Lentinus tigrinus ALCF2SS1-6]RPD71123.1 hypothetical protein L226DRAFT_574134 [Lentinus tigrinus ALCF2SS1-7]
MLTPILPPELEDYIISFLREDSRTLCVCARVCKEWLTVCRTYLFDKVSFETPQAYASFVEQVLGSLRLQTSLEMVHRIEILSPQADGFMEQSLADTFLRDTHGTFLNLHILRISNVNWGYLLTSHTYKLFDVNATPPFPRLKELAITNVVFPSEHVLAQLLVSLPNLASLSLYGIAFPLGNWDWLFPTIRVRDSAPYRSTTLKTLSVDGYYPFAPPLVAWFVEQFPEARVSLRKLQFTSEYWVPLLDALGPTSALNTSGAAGFAGASDESEPIGSVALRGIPLLPVLVRFSQHVGISRKETSVARAVYSSPLSPLDA